MEMIAAFLQLIGAILAIILLVVYFIAFKRIGAIVEYTKETAIVIKNISNMIETSDWNKLKKSKWTCPKCNETVKGDQIKCWHCGYSPADDL
jgi:hypothetical protein